MELLIFLILVVNIGGVIIRLGGSSRDTRRYGAKGAGPCRWVALLSKHGKVRSWHDYLYNNLFGTAPSHDSTVYGYVKKSVKGAR